MSPSTAEAALRADNPVIWLITAVLVVAAALPLPAGAAVSPNVSRLAGADRFDTAARASSLAFPEGADTVHVTNGDRFVDALAAGPSAALRAGPLLLVTSDGVPAATARELARLRPRSVVISGGPLMVSDHVARRLRDATGAEVERIAGADRFATAGALATGSFSAPVPVAFVASGVDFPDALAGGPAAARAGGPLLLSTSTSLPPATVDALDALRPARIVVLGGPAAIGDGVLDALRGFTSGVVERYAGDTRIDTAVAISRVAFPTGAPVTYLATGNDFPDALGGGPAAAKQGGPLLLLQHDTLPPAVVHELRRLDPERVVILGGPQAVSERLAVQVQARLDSGDVGALPTWGTTGPYDWSVLRPSGSITVTVDGTIVEDLDVDGCIQVKANHVTLRNLRVRCPGNGHPDYAIRTHGRWTGTVIHHVELSMHGPEKIGPMIVGPHDLVHHVRTDDRSGADWVRVSSGAVYHDNFVIVGKPSGSAQHVDAIQSTGSSDVVIRNNVLIARAAEGGNAALMIDTSLGPTDDWLIEGNYLSGGNYTVFWRENDHGCPTNGRLIDNRFGRDHRYGIFSGAGCGIRHEGNVWADDGEPAPIEG